ncbi:ABC transporter ATP-binding protein [Terracidiphilus gabretensis]|jgi:ATP-binding cassette subfamily B multidrug efflux pump|uniref:ABC transporter ATP-binding protein n=1 Tax=Terracidiphilus gabretensis TaxID=1577687 RepID=UPI00071B5EDD|nr:ABC transporter ATP-binding protein [Terracidiphilus gabretensis]
MLRDLRPLFSYMRRYRWGYVWGSLSVVATNAISVQFPRVVGKAVDSFRDPSTTRSTILILAGLLVVIGITKGVFLYAQRWILIGISREIEFDLRNDLFRHLESQDSGFYRRYHTGDIMARMTNDLNAVRMLLGPAIMYSANTLMFTVCALFYLLRVSPYLTLIALAPAPLASLLVQYLGRKIHERFERIQAGFSEISSQAQENFSANRLVRAFAQEEAQIALFEKLNRSYIARSLRLVQLMGMLWPTLEFILGGSMVLTLLVGGHQVIEHKISVGQFVEFNTYMLLLIFPVIALGWVVNIFQRGTASVARIDEMMREKPAIDDSQADTSIPADTILSGEIEFRNLSFRYDEGAQDSLAVLRDISLRIPAGSSLAIVGPTGSGKTTLVNTLSRLLEAPDGSLLIDGRPVRQYPLAVLRHNIGMVPQETFLFSETLRENLGFGAPGAAAQELLDAAEAAHIRKEFEEFPQGFETMVGERGVTLSGGQKQRTAIARALLRRPAILILDDALASVDTYTEERILGGLRNYTAGATTILISHRVSTVRNADQIAVLDKGRIVELGTHDDLLALDGYYAGLYQKQQLEEELAVAS